MPNALNCAFGGLVKIIVNLGKKHESWNRQSRVLGYAIKAILEAQTQINVLYLKMFDVPPLYESGVRYRQEPKNTIEEFATIPVIYERLWGDCDDLAPARAAELRLEGNHAQVRIVWKKNRKNGHRMYHIVVRHQDGRIEDPSKILGMR